MATMRPEFAFKNPTPLTFGAGGVIVALPEAGGGVPEVGGVVFSLVAVGVVSTEVAVVPVSVD